MSTTPTTSTQALCLYLSQLSHPSRYDVFAAIAQGSRVRNATDGIGGALLFDGHRFCQLVQGPADKVQALMQRIGADVRHRDLLILAQHQSAGALAVAAWASGYCDVDALDGFEGPLGLRDEAAVAAFQALLGKADLIR